ncbi:ATP-binding protein [Stieleria varia]|uniref:ATP-dependent zinc metalloprotease FtsH n=1 Tax=Stieleria varia TaxID=2528005 RepID=A0A5C5ZZI6_9BACT|nr:ATP-binding protein [Stieleria varia]TWT91753.1 ATP-dependent zinc metalloprotease FtsH [Stieleria varia]
MNGSELAIAHLLLKLRPINRALRAAVTVQANRAANLDRPDLKHLCITDVHVAALLSEVDCFAQESDNTELPLSEFNGQERQLELQIRKQASARKLPLPLDVLRDSLHLTAFEIDTLLTCAASELHPGYERIFGYILDDMNRRFPCIELLASLNASGRSERLARRSVLGSAGRLRRTGMLQPLDESTTNVRTQLRLAEGVLDFLLGCSATVSGIWRDIDEVELVGVNDSVDEGDPRIERIGTALADGAIGIVGLWGPEDAGLESVARSVARAAHKSLRRFRISADTPESMPRQVHNAVQTAALCDAILLVETDLLRNVECRVGAETLISVLARCDVPALLSGGQPWRPTELLANRTYVELPMLNTSDHKTREQIWSRTIPEMEADRTRELASRFRMTDREIRAVGRMARAQAGIESNGKPASVDSQLAIACSAVAQKTRGRFLGVVNPKRGPEDLILTPELHRQVLEIADFSRVMPLVAETWGFGRLATGGVGMKCLFTGDPGTGKTLAAEVIARQTGTPLLKVNIAEVVSKWVGETEKNLDGAFKEAISSHAVLFFDEADALFGKRGDVRTGVDRYANLEVSHLLQRLEEHDGLVILASNLKDNIDSAFIRRFHVMLHFPRPGETERRRIWEIAFPEQAPLDAGVDLSSLSRLDMTGAGIVGAARTAALLAAQNQASRITMSHIVRAIARQFRREARVLSTRELGRYADLLQERT